MELILSSRHVRVKLNACYSGGMRFACWYGDILGTLYTTEFFGVDCGVILGRKTISLVCLLVFVFLIVV